MGGWIKLHRKVIKSPMYKQLNSKQRDVMITILLLANHESNTWEFRGEIYNVSPGQFVTSLDSLKENCASDVSIQNIRTALLKLEKHQFLTNESTKKNRLITVVNWGIYQVSNDELTKTLTDSQQSTNRQLTTNKNIKNYKNEKEVSNTVDSNECDIAFEDFWNLYPEKKGKTTAKKKWQTLWKNKKIDIQKVMDGTQKYIEFVKYERTYRAFDRAYKNGSTFVSQESWNDEYDIKPSNVVKGNFQNNDRPVERKVESLYDQR